MIDFLFSRFRVFRVRLRYYYYQARIKYSYIDFIWDNSSKYNHLLSKLKNKHYKKAIIIGNAPNATALTLEQYEKYENDDTVLTIGLNKSYLLFNTDLILWGDHFVLRELLKYDKKLSETTFLFASQLLDDRRSSLGWWKKNKSFSNYPFNTLFKARTILISALYLAYILDIKEIELYGISLDDGTRFYENKEVNSHRKTIEFLSQEEINKTYYGYDVQKIVQEVLQYLISDGLTVNYGGESNFLNSIPGIKKC